VVVLGGWKFLSLLESRNHHNTRQKVGSSKVSIVLHISTFLILIALGETSNSGQSSQVSDFFQYLFLQKHLLNLFEHDVNK
jgi:hypothetical protein